MRSKRGNELMNVLEICSFMLILVGAFAIPMLPTAKATNWTVDISSYTFTPHVIDINVGDTITWTNNDPAIHSITSNTSAWTQLTVNSATSVTSLPFNTVGNFGYHCIYHSIITFPGMWGQINVTGIPEFSSAAMTVMGLLGVVLGLFIIRRRQ